MTIRYLKKATKTAVSTDDEVRPVVAEMLARIEADGEDATRDYARQLDGWEGDILVSQDTLTEAERRTLGIHSAQQPRKQMRVQLLAPARSPDAPVPAK